MNADRSSHTAEGAIFVRLLHQQLPRRQRILIDPWINRLALYDQWWIARIPFLARYALRKRPRMVDYVPARDRFADEVIDEAVRQGTRQIVVLGAGLDSISYRVLHRHPDCLMYEVDHPATQAVKIRRARPLAAKFAHAIRYIATDFEHDDFRGKLQEGGFRPDQPSAIIWMGVVYYLSEAAVVQTFSRARDLMTVGSPLAFDFWAPTLTQPSGDPEFEQQRQDYAKIGESLKFGIDPLTLADFVKPLGYDVSRSESFNSLDRRYVQRDMKSPEGMCVAAIVAAPR